MDGHRGCRRGQGGAAGGRRVPKDRRRFERLGASIPKGVLLYGPPGTGKTLLAKAVAKESGANFYSASASSFVEMFAGLGAARIRKLFTEARKNAPAIVFIDELDAVGTARGGNGFNREQDQTLNQLLVELDGFGGREDVIVMGASNRLQDLDPALLRPGRFDRQVHVSPPDVVGREAILRVHTRSKPLAADVDLGSSRAGLPGSPAPSSRTSRTRRRSSPRARVGSTSTWSTSTGPRTRPHRAPEASGRHREGEADSRLPRGRPRADGVPDGRADADPEGDDRRPRRRARTSRTTYPPRIVTFTRGRS